MIIRLIAFIFLSVGLTSCSQNQTNTIQQNKNEFEITNHKIVIDGNSDDWNSIPATSVETKDHLWLGGGLPAGEWQGINDLSFDWKVAHNDGKLFFLFEVKDDTLSNFDQQHSWMNDCIEIYLDHQNIGGNRITEIASANTLQDRIGKRLRGHELHFLPSVESSVFLDDTEQIYYTDSAQTETFKKQWHGQVVTTKTTDGYIMEIAFAMPNFYAQAGDKIGIDVGICDDDGSGRKSLLLWSAYKGEFWLTMDNFKKAVLK